MNKQSILIIDDNNENIKVAGNIIKNDNNIVWASLNPEEGLAIAMKKNPNLILLDIQMPEMDGFTVCKKLKENDTTRNIPVIFMTARTDEESIKKAYSSGAVDYISKPIKKQELLARVNTHLKISHLIQELKSASYTDGLTSLYNHKKIFEVLESEIAKSKRYNRKLSILMLDIDYFKRVNDEHGHLKGDEVLEIVAKTIQTEIRDIDISGRYGGEEFLIVFPESEKNQAYIGAERIRKKIQNLNLGEGIKVTISGGIAEYRDHKVLELIQEADNNLYYAKENGRNQVFG